MATPIDVLLVKFGQWEIDEIVLYLPDKQNRILPASQTVAAAWIMPKICLGEPRQCTPDFIQIVLLSVEL